MGFPEYEIDRFNDSFLEGIKLPDIKKFDFDSKEFETAIEEALKIQENIDSMLRKGALVNLDTIVCRPIPGH